MKDLVKHPLRMESLSEKVYFKIADTTNPPVTNPPVTNPPITTPPVSNPVSDLEISGEVTLKKHLSDSGLKSHVVIEFDTNRASECRYSVSADDFNKMNMMNISNAHSHATLLWNLQSSKEYTYYLKCRDANGGESNHKKISFVAL